MASSNLPWLVASLAQMIIHSVVSVFPPAVCNKNHSELTNDKQEHFDLKTLDLGCDYS